MSTTAIIDATAPAESQEKIAAIFNGLEEHLGFLPEGIKLFGISPTLLENFANTAGYFMAQQELSQDLLFMIRYLNSQEVNCAFCIGFTEGMLLNNLGKTQEQLEAARDNPDNSPLTEAEIVLLKIALASMDNPEGVSEADMKKAREAGFTDKNIFEAVVVAANNRAFTHILRTFKVEGQGSLA